MDKTEKVPPAGTQAPSMPFPDHYFGAMEEWDELTFEAINGHERYFEGDYDPTNLR